MRTDRVSFGSIPSTNSRVIALPTAALLFLFSGFYKGLIPAPVDLTVLACVITCIALAPHLRAVDAHRAPATWLLAALTAYLAIRLLPAPPSWGARKFGETLLFGIPAFLAGHVIAQRPDTQRFLLTALSYAAIPSAAVMVASAALTNPYSYPWSGSGGYQLAGIFMGLALIAAATTDRYVCFGFAALGLAVSGSISAALFSAPAVALIWISRRKQIVKQAASALLLLTIYTATVAPPLILMRVLWKIGSVENAITSGPDSSRYGGAAVTTSLLQMMPEASRKYLVDSQSSDRIDIFANAWSKFTEAPWIGHGYGAVDYLGNPYPHNVILEMLAEGGLVGGLLLLAAIAASRPPLSDDGDAFAAATLVFLVGAAMVGGYWGGRVLLFFIGFSIGRQSCAR